MIEQVKFLYSLLEKPNKTNWRSKKKQIETLRNHGKELAVPNEINKKDFNINKDGKPIEKQKQKNSINLLKKNLLSFRIWKKKLILIIWYISTKLKKQV